MDTASAVQHAQRSGADRSRPRHRDQLPGQEHLKIKVRFESSDVILDCAERIARKALAHHFMSSVI